MSMLSYLYGWIALVIAVVALAIRRQMVARQEDETLRLGDSESTLVANQLTVGRSLGRIDRLGQVVTVVAAIYGLALLSVYLYGVWLARVRVPS
jgi:hypothetical protein